MTHENTTNDSLVSLENLKLYYYDPLYSYRHSERFFQQSRI